MDKTKTSLPYVLVALLSLSLFACSGDSSVPAPDGGGGNDGASGDQSGGDGAAGADGAGDTAGGETGGDTPSDTGGGDTPGTDGGKGEAPPPMTEGEQFCRDFVDAYIDLVSKCLGISRAFLETLAFDPVSSCAGVNGSLKAGRLTYDGAAAKACLAKIGAISCDDILGSMAEMIDLMDCEKAMAGTVTPGGTCYEVTFNECTTGNYCSDAGSGTCPGKCAPVAKEGEDCADGTPCDSGLVCGPLDTCAKRVGEGETCGDTSHCLSGLYCDTDLLECAKQKTSGDCTSAEECAAGYDCAGAAVSGMGTCEVRKKIGDACTPGPLVCGAGVGFCTGGKCADYPTEGMPCGLIGGDLALCVYSYCDAESLFMTGTCQPFKNIGDDCDPMAMLLGSECGPGAECSPDTSKCVKTTCEAP